MLQRCYNENHVSYKEYGGRGITVLPAWIPVRDDTGALVTGSRATAFGCFVRDAGLRPSQKYTLDRLNANGHYVPNNVKWATAIEQGSNKRTTHYVRHPTGGHRIAAAYLAREKNMTYQALRASMLKAGTWFVETFADQPTTEKPLPKEG